MGRLTMADRNRSKKMVSNFASKVAVQAENTANKVTAKATDAALLSKDAVANAKAQVIAQLDKNGDGQVSIDDIIVLALKAPGIHISRSAFLQRELFKNHPQDVIDRAIASTPAQAGIPADEVDRLAEEVIKRERFSVSGISAALGAPGGWAMAATIPADIIQYYSYTLRAVQELLYLYGFPEISTDADGLTLDSETINSIIICLGVMNGVAGANNAIKAMAKALAVGVEKQLMKQALTKGTVFPVVKNIMKWFGVNLTKSLFTGAIKNAIPVVGGVLGGGITFFSFKPCCCNLKNALKDTMLSNPQHISSEDESRLADSIFSGEIPDAEFEALPNTDDAEA